VTGTCRRLYYYELRDYYSQNIREINTRRMILIGHSAGMTSEKFVYSNDWKTEGKRTFGCCVCICVYGRMPLKIILKKLSWRLWTGFNWLGTGRKFRLL